MEDAVGLDADCSHAANHRAQTNAAQAAASSDMGAFGIKATFTQICIFVY